MKKRFQKILSVVFGSVLLSGLIFPVNFISAASWATFNNNSKDYPTAQVVNATDHSNCSTCWSPSVSARAGDEISFQIYYHNNSSVTAQNTKVKFSLPSGAFQNDNATGSVWADNAAIASNTVSINLSSRQSLSFISGSLKWYPDRSDYPITLPSGQNEENIISSGINIGDIGAGWSTQGELVFRMKVGESVNYSLTATTGAAINSYDNTYNVRGTLYSQTYQNTSYWFEYGTNASLGSQTPTRNISVGNNSELVSDELNNLQSNITYYYRLAARGQSGNTVYGSTLSFTTQNNSNNGSAPYATTHSATGISQSSATLQGAVNPNSSNTNIWFEYGTTSSFGYTTGYQSIGNGNYSTSVSGYLSGLQQNATYYYRLVAQNSYGTVYGNTLSFNTNSGYQNGNAPVVSTLAANSIYQNAALLNATVNPMNGLTSAWFEWGTTVSLGNQTTSQPMGSGNGNFNMSFALTGLKAGTTYYFRSVAQNPYGSRYGSIETFTTQRILIIDPVLPPIRKPIIINQSVSGKDIILISAIDKSVLEKGNDAVYTISYKNNTSKTANNAVIRIILPTEVDYLNSNIAPASVSANSLSFNLGNVNAGGEGAISVRTRIRNSISDGSALVWTAIFEYTNSKGAFASEVNYLTVMVRETGALTASIFDALRSLLGNWIFYLLLLIAFIVYLFTYIRGKREQKAPFPTLPAATSEERKQA